MLKFPLRQCVITWYVVCCANFWPQSKRDTGIMKKHPTSKLHRTQSSSLVLLHLLNLCFIHPELHIHTTTQTKCLSTKAFLQTHGVHTRETVQPPAIPTPRKPYTAIPTIYQGSQHPKPPFQISPHQTQTFIPIIQIRRITLRISPKRDEERKKQA